jgi:hypothetical protein
MKLAALSPSLTATPRLHHHPEMDHRCFMRISLAGASRT